LAKTETTPSERETTRVQFEMPPKSMERLRTLKDATEAGSYAEVFRDALRFYEFLIQQAQEGNEVVVENKKDATKRTLLIHH